MTAIGSSAFILMLCLILFIGVEHPPTRGANLPPEMRTDQLGAFRTVLGLLSLAIPVLTFPPFLIEVVGG
jgi:hypothetical protein